MPCLLILLCSLPFPPSPLKDSVDLETIVGKYTTDQAKIVKFYLDAKRLANDQLRDGTNHKPHYSLRTLCRALMHAQWTRPIYGPRALFDGFCVSFLTQLDFRSYGLMLSNIKKLFPHEQTKLPPCPDANKFVQVLDFWLSRGPEEPEVEVSKYIMTKTVERNLQNVARAVSSKRFPVLLQGPTSSGKTSLVEYLVCFVCCVFGCVFGFVYCYCLLCV